MSLALLLAGENIQQPARNLQFPREELRETHRTRSSSALSRADSLLAPQPSGVGGCLPLSQGSTNRDRPTASDWVVTSAVDADGGSLPSVLSSAQPGDRVILDSSFAGQTMVLTKGPIRVRYNQITLDDSGLAFQQPDRRSAGDARFSPHRDRPFLHAGCLISERPRQARKTGRITPRRQHRISRTNPFD